jgi:hypothetical protein
MRLAPAFVRMAFVASSACVLWVACSDDDPPARPVEQTGSSCTAPSQCYPGVADAGALKGAVVCLDRVPGGYCTHECTSDADCCAVPGECKTGFKQVCSPFESTGKQYCFLSCESDDIKAATDGGTTDSTLYCQTYANKALGCRSSGGGSANRKVCVP